jgi:hypothetical protein
VFGFQMLAKLQGLCIIEVINSISFYINWSRLVDHLKTKQQIGFYETNGKPGTNCVPKMTIPILDKSGFQMVTVLKSIVEVLKACQNESL